ncbi:MAG: DUF2231 domain-containing protein [Flavobacteriales bacterium]|nr:DUF2231 domain-containing protein [Flavobacteriales bacterium]
MNTWELHPAFVHFPIALLLSGVVLDLYGWRKKREDLSRVAYGLLVAGVIMGLLTIITGVMAYYTVPAHTEAAHERMTWHIWIQSISIGVFGLMCLLRWKQRKSLVAPRALFLSVSAAVLLIVGSYLGAWIVYRGGAGVDPAILSHEVREGHHHHHGGEMDDDHDGDHHDGDHHDDDARRRPASLTPEQAHS